MKVLIVLIVLVATTSAHALTVYKTNEYTRGQARYCVYEMTGTEYVRTVRLNERCPLTIEV